MYSYLMCLLVLIVGILQISNCVEVTTIATIANNTTNQIQTVNITMERITQPVSQTQQIDRKLLMPDITNNNKTDNKKIIEEFRPSPHLETYYEFNRFPVIPALPESKHITATNLNSGELPHHLRQLRVTTEATWYSKVKFPSPTSQDRPYQFTISNDKSQGKSYNNNTYHTKSDGSSSVNKPSTSSLTFVASSPTVTNKFPFNTGIIKSWDKYEKDGLVRSRRPAINPQLDYGLIPEKSYDISNHQHKNNFDSYDGLSEKPHSTMSLQHEIPWKKIIKFLTAFIPIGLLLSALTPTVITVTSINDTQSRLRAENHSQRVISSSINYFHKLNVEGCEERILCELLLSASSSKDAEKHVENLLDTFTKNNGKVVEQANRMKRVFEAVKSQNCSKINCNKIKDNS